MPSLIFPFRPYRGYAIDRVPTSYLVWLEKQPWLSKWPAVEAYIRGHWETIKQAYWLETGKEVGDE